VLRIPGIAIVTLGLLACDTPSAPAPVAAGSTRMTMVEKLPQGTEVTVALISSTVAAGTTFMVQGAGNGDGAYCSSNAGTTLHLHEITLVGGASDPDGLRFINYTFSDWMPPGTQFRILGLASPLMLCAGNYAYRAVIANGSGA
jgi:hypothetical protein